MNLYIYIAPVGLTNSDIAREDVVELDDRAVCHFRVVLSWFLVAALASKDESVVLLLQQDKDVVEQDHVMIDVLRAVDPPRQDAVVDHLVSSQIEFLADERN